MVQKCQVFILTPLPFTITIFPKLYIVNHENDYSCTLDSQLSYSPRVVSECGLTDGKGIERLWSYLRRFAKISKEMRPSHRIDVLTSALVNYASKASHKLGTCIFILSRDNSTLV